MLLYALLEGAPLVGRFGKLSPFGRLWYGFDGDFGTTDRGRFHSISDPERLDEQTIRYQLDCGRAEAHAIDDLLKRLGVLHNTHTITGVLIGRGFLPAAP